MTLSFNRDAFRKYFANTSWLLGERAFNIVAGVVVGVLVARHLGPEKFGLLNFAISFAFLFFPFSALGLEGIIVKNLVNQPDRRDEFLGTGFLLQLGGALFVFLLLLPAVQWTENDRESTMLIFIIAGSVLFHPFNVIDFYFQSRVQSKFVVLVKTVQTVLTASCRVALVYFQAPVLWFAVVILFESALLGAGLGGIFLYRSTSLRWKFSLKTARELLKESAPLLLSGIAVSVYMKIDHVMIREMLDTRALGNYAVAVRLCEAWYFIPVVITGSLLPAILDSKNRGEVLYRDRVQKLYNLMVLLSLFIAVTTAFLGDRIIALLFGPEFNGAANVLKVYAWASVFIFLGVASGKWLIAEKLTKISLQRALAGCGVNVGLNLILIPRYGITGAAIATIAAHATSGYLFDIVHRETWTSFKMKTRSLTFLGFFR